MQRYMERLHIPSPLHDDLLSAFNNLKSLQKGDIFALCHEQAEESYIRFSKQYGDMEMLALYLIALEETHRLYQEKGIDESIFDATMACFPRFILETHRKFGIWTFDRHFWTYRQTSLRLFRLGELEYEFTGKEISIHIPSDAKFSRESILQSIAMMKEFVGRYFPSYAGMSIVCSSWLLSKQILDMLKKESGIAAFASFFDIEQGKPCNDVFMWLFDCRQPDDLTVLKEETSLQKKAKAYLLGGGIIYEGKGILKEEYL